jgi:tetratricopeptide (TPR) repeat protein
MLTFRSFTTCVAAALTLGLIGSAAAQQPVDDWARCLNQDQSFTRAIAIEGCTALIQSGSESGRNLAGAFYTRGNLYHAEGDFDRALADYNAGIQADATFSDTYNARGNTYADRGQVDRAIADFDTAIQLRANDPLPHNGRGNAYLGKGDFARAIADYDEALRLDAKYAVAYRNRAVAELKVGKIGEAIADYDTVLMLDPDRPNALFGRGLAKLGKGDMSGKADIAAAKSRQPDVAADFAKYGLAEPAASAGAPPANDCANAAAHWTSAESIGSIQVYQDHLARFPNCAFAALATARIESLRQKAAIPATCGKREVLKEGRCVAKACPTGSDLDSDGDCVHKKETGKRVARGATSSRPASSRSEQGGGATLDCTNPVGLANCAARMLTQH